MKSTITIILLAIAALVSSCNKEGDWICTCTVDGKKQDLITYDIKKKEAKSRCRDVENKLPNYKGCRLTGEE